MIGLSFQPVILGDLLIYEKIYTSYAFGQVNLTDIKNDPAYYLYILLMTQFLGFQTYLLAHKILFYASLSAAIVFSKKLNLYYLVAIPLLMLYLDPYLNGYSEFVLRQGTGFIILFLFGFYKMNGRTGYVASIIASFFHASFILALLILFITKWLTSIKFLLYLAFLSAIIYTTHFPIYISFLTSDFAPRALSVAGDNYTIGFKPLFFFASFGVYVLLFFKKYRFILRQNDSLYRLWAFYTLGIFISVLISGMPYHDRMFSFFWVCQYFIIYDVLTRLRIYVSL